MHNLVVYATITNQTVNDSVLTEGTLDHNANYDAELRTVFGAVKSYYNNFYADGWPLSNLNPMLAMAAGLIKNTTASPFVTNEWLLCGFEMQADLPNESDPVLDFIV